MKDILIKLREDNRYTQTAMAKLLGISRQAYMKYETGDVEPPVEVIRKLKDVYKVSYEILIDNRVDLLEKLSDQNTSVSYENHSPGELYAVSPTPAYGSSKTAVKQTIQDSSLDEFATMLFSVAANLKTENKLTAEEKIAQFEVYAKLAEAEMEIANGDKGIDIDTAFSKIMGEKWTKKYIQ